MTRRVVIIGAGMGGLTAAVRLARKGLSVRVIEARTEAGDLRRVLKKMVLDLMLAHMCCLIVQDLNGPFVPWVSNSLSISVSAESMMFMRCYRVQASRFVSMGI